MSMAYSPPHALVRGRSCCSWSDAIHRQPRSRLGRRALRGRRPRPRRAAAAGPRGAGRRARRRCWPGPGCWRRRWPSRRPSPPSACATPVAGGAAAYVRAAYGRRAAAVTGWWFYAGVVGGAPAVWLIGGFYVAHLTGGGRAVAVAAAAAMMVAVVAANARGLRATARMQLGLAALLAVLLLVAVTSALPSARAANWTPFAPHGWLAIGTAANLLMLSFVGWEAVAHLAGDFADPRRQLPRAMLAAFAHRRRPLPRPRGDHGGRPRRRAGLDGAAGRPHAARPRRRRQRAHRGRRRPAHRRHDERLRRRRHAPGRRAGGRRLDAARDGAARSAAGRHRRGERRHPRRAGRGARRRRPDRARDLDLLRRGLRRRHGGRGAAARRAPARGGGLSLALVVVVLAFSGPYVAAPAAVALLALGVRQCPCGWRSLAGIFSRSWLSCRRDRSKRPRRAGMEAEREAPAVGRDGGDVDLRRGRRGGG